MRISTPTRVMPIKRVAIGIAVWLLAAAPAVTASNPLLANASDWYAALPGLEILNPSPRVPDDLEFEDAKGRLLSLSAAAGRLRLVNLWATWCAPCREEMPALDRLSARLGDRGLKVFAIASGPNRMDDIERFYERAQLTTLAIHRDPASRFAAALGATALPSTFVVGPDGRILARLIGDAQWDAPAVVAVIRDQLSTESRDHSS
ncbi:TlpA disulfide reductase family protein [Spiribacter sp. 218]|uniref:TlpA disulfide reductase family protein n=1 Tax=Spiribacter pallidus TaxID=1987936 RepID=UPI00349F6E97